MGAFHRGKLAGFPGGNGGFFPRPPSRGGFYGSDRGATALGLHGVLAGQSNANGQGDTAKSDPGLYYLTAYPNVQLDTKIGTTNGDPITYTTVAQRDLQPYAVGNPGMGAELAYGQHFYETNGYTGGVAPIYLSKFGVTGSQISQWLPGSGIPVNGGETWVQFTNYIDARVAATGKPIDYIVWIQGEADATSTVRADAYQTNLTTFVNALRARYGNTFIFAIARLNSNMTGGGILATPRATVQAAQDAYVAANPTNSCIVNTDDLPLNADNLHYPSDSLNILGARLAEAAAQKLRPGRISNSGSGPAPWIQRNNMPVVISASAATTMTPYLPAHEAGDLIVVVAMNSIANANPVLTTANGFTELTVSSSNTGATYCKTAVYTKTATTSSESAPVIAPGAGTAQAMCMAFTVRGTSGIDVSATGANNAFVSGAFSVPGVTTTGADRLIVYILGVHGGNPTNGASALANAALDGFAEERDSLKSVAAAYPLIVLATGTKASAGATGNATGSFATNALWASVAIAFKP